MSDLLPSEPVFAPIPVSPQMEERLSGAYQRIVRVAVVLSVAASAIAALLAGWRNGLGLALGALVGLLNFVWLHHGADVLVHRMLFSGNKGPGKLWVWLSFPLRYLLVIAAVYAMIKGYPRMLIGFIVGLALPVMASMSEGIYEALVLK